MTKKRWPQFEGWDEKAAAIEILAQACGASVYCSQKYEYLNVEIQRLSSSREELLALHEMANMIEKLTDQELFPTTEREPNLQTRH